MKKLKAPRSRFVCQTCGAVSIKWQGKCSECENWNTFVEELEERASASKLSGRVLQEPQKLLKISSEESIRLKSLHKEFDRVLGGGMVSGSLVLIGGIPGIGKSTLLIEIANSISKNYGDVLYVSAEESTSQIKLRADRLGIDSEKIYLLSETDMEAIKEQILKLKPKLVVIDSVQTVYLPEFSASPGSISQVREVTRVAMELAKRQDITVVLVGHVTKDGALAGPRVLEHMVDTVLYFEGENFQSFRILKSIKNRFGATNEVGVFEMTSRGLKDVSNVSEFFLSQRPKDNTGSSIVPVMEGTRSLLVELQALVTKTSFGLPTRRATGFDYNRLALIIAVLEKRANLFLGNCDVFANVVGGMTVDDLSADLGLAVAIVSSLKDISLAKDLFILGELGLGGEVRGSPQIEMRVREAKKLGFTKGIIPSSSLNEELKKMGLTFVGVENIKQAIREISK